jgi:Winged helix DNA-binding domain
MAAAPSGPVLGARELNRALLARNLLLERSPRPVTDAVEHLVGLQAQEPQEPYVGLFSRLRDLDPAEPSRLLEERVLVRTLMMRRTIHLLSAADCLRMRALHQPMLAQRSRSVLRSRLVGVDEAELAGAGHPLFHAEPRTLTDVGRAVHERWPNAAPRDLGDALSSLIPLVQVPPRGLWRRAGPARNTTIAAWLGHDVEQPAPDPDDLVLRYLAAYGPAASADIRAWSGLSGLRAAVDRLLPGLRTFRDERGRLLLDLPDGPLPDPGTPAPPRFLPAFDNAVLGYDDRSRIIDDADRGLSVTGARFLLVDGRVRGTWTAELTDREAVLRITPLGSFTPHAAPDEVQAEGSALLGFLFPESTDRRVTWVTATG